MEKLLLTSTTSLSDITSFTGKLHSTAVLHAKHDKATGGVVIYASKGHGTGFKHFFDPHKIERRRIRAGRALDACAQNNDAGIALRQKVAGKVGALSVREKWGNGLLAGELKGLALLPTSATVDNQRYFSGTQTVNVVPATEKMPDLKRFEGKSIDEFMNETANIVLQKSEKKEYFSEPVPTQANRDLYRFKYTIPQNDGSIFDSTKISADFDAQDARNKCIFAALQDFTGNEKATVVLSSILTQNTIILLPYMLSSSLIPAKNTELLEGKNKVMISGQEDNILKTLPAMGAANWALSKEGGNFKVSIDWITYLSNRDGPLQLAEGNLVQARITMELLVDAAEAERAT